MLFEETNYVSIRDEKYFKRLGILRKLFKTVPKINISPRKYRFYYFLIPEEKHQ